MLRNSVQVATLTSLDGAALTGAYQNFNTSGFPGAPFLVRIINNSADRDVTVSFDGLTDHDFVPFKTSIQLPVQSNNAPNNFTALFAKGTKVWIKGAGGGGAGFIYLAAYYQANQ